MVGLLEVRHSDQPPIVAIRPAMIGAGEMLGIAYLGATQPVAAMAADVEKGMDLPSAVPHDQHGVFSHVGAEEIARVSNLALMAEEQPAAREDLLQLLLVDLLVDEDTPTNEALLDIHQLFDVGRHGALLPSPTVFAKRLWDKDILTYPSGSVKTLTLPISFDAAYGGLLRRRRS